MLKVKTVQKMMFDLCLKNRLKVKQTLYVIIAIKY